MPKRIIYLGPFNNKQQEKLIQMSLEKLRKNKGDEFYYLLPNGELLTEYRREFIDQVKQTFEINLYTFDNIVKNILAGEAYFEVNETIKDLIIKKVIRQIDSLGELTYYKDFIHMEGFAQSLNGIIGEIKRSLVYPEEFLENSPQIAYYREIGLIYRKYEEYLKEHNLIDREGSYFKAIEILRNSTSYFKGLEFIIIDEFYDFRPIEIAILEELCKSNIDIYINIPFDMETRPANIEETINILNDLGFQEKYVEKEEKAYFETMGKNFFSHGVPKLNYNENLSLIKSPSIYLEMKRIFEEIKRLHIKGVNLREIAIVLLSEEYKEILFQVAKEEGLPISLKQEKPLIHIPLVREFLNLINVKINNKNKQSIINRIKSNYFPIIDSEYKYGLEYILRKLNFENINDLVNLLGNEQQLNITMDYIDPIKNISKQIIDEISRIEDQDFIENYNKMFLQIIEEYNIEEKIHKRYKREKDFELFYRDISSLERLKGIIEALDGISKVLEEISIEDYFEVLSRLFQEELILSKDENIKGVKILNLINSRGFNHEIIFITGLSQEHYPKLKENNFFINDENYNSLKSIGLDVKNYYERLDNEVVKFASLLSSSKSKVYLSFSEGLEGEDISSIFLDEILNMIKGESLKDKLRLIDIDLGYLVKEDINQITTKEELSNYLILNHYEDLSEKSKEYFSIHNTIHGEKFERVNNKILSEFKRNKKDFNEYSGLIDDKGIIEDILNENKTRVYSNSFLEAYGKCPYAFLLSRLLSVEEMERFFEEYSPKDIGNIYHEVLNQYYRSYKKDITNYVKETKDFKIQDTLEFLKDLVYRYGEEVGLDSENKANLLILENTYDRIKDFIEADLKRISNPREKLIPHSFEVEFGKRGDFAIEIDGKEVKLRGTIDRIDKFVDKDKYVIMDYKSSDYGIYDIDKIKEGISLQLPIYAISQKNKDIVAGLYGTLSNSRFQLTIGILEETKIVRGNHKGALDREGWTSLMDKTKENIKNIKENIFKADFSVNPLECSKYCIYKDICRYEKLSEVE